MYQSILPSNDPYFAFNYPEYPSSQSLCTVTDSSALRSSHIKTRLFSPTMQMFNPCLTFIAYKKGLFQNSDKQVRMKGPGTVKILRSTNLIKISTRFFLLLGNIFLVQNYDSFIQYFENLKF